MTSARMAGIQACVFDAYGTLFDVHSAVARLRARLGERADALSQLWRAKQLEYTWLRALMGRHADFWRVTGDALDYALAQTGADPALREPLMEAYLALGASFQHLGELGRARAHFEQALALVDSPQHRAHIVLYGQDPQTIGLADLACILWVLAIRTRPCSGSMKP